jgi:hypothetical protein
LAIGEYPPGVEPPNESAFELSQLKVVWDRYYDRNDEIRQKWLNDAIETADRLTTHYNLREPLDPVFLLNREPPIDDLPDAGPMLRDSSGRGGWVDEVW